VADGGDADGEGDCDGLAEALGADGDGEADGLPVRDGDGLGAAGAGEAAEALPCGGVDTALLGGASGTLARMSSGRAVSRDGLS
jgi:hypothetical protein